MNNTGILYLFCTKSAVKIGVTTFSVYERLKTINTSAQNKIGYIYTIPLPNRKIAFQVETFAKELFHSKKFNNEWFKKDNGLILELNDYLFENFNKNLTYRKIDYKDDYKSFNVGSEEELKVMPKTKRAYEKSDEAIKKEVNSIYKKYGL